MFSAEALQEWKPILVEHGAEAVESLLRIVIIIVLGWIGVRLLKRVLRKMEGMLISDGQRELDSSHRATEMRVKTLTGVLRTGVVIGIWTLVVVSALGEIGVKLGPLLAGAGIAGLAVGFGAQNLVRDVISGFFMILENQVRVGDVAVVNGVEGMVESIGFRTIVLRDVRGTVHVFPHGQVQTLANQTLGWSAYMIDVAVSYDTDTDKAVAVMKRVHEELAADPGYQQRLLGPIEVFGIDSFGANEMVIRARLKTRPLEQWGVGREYRRRLKLACDQEGIEIAPPARQAMIEPRSPRLGRATKNSPT